MAKKIIKFDCLSVSSIRQAQRELEKYRNELPVKCERFIKKLAEKGIKTAQSHTGGYGKYITFSIKTDPDVDGCEGVLLATNTGIIRSEWKTKEGNKSADVSPLLMVEFGSGPRAKNPMKVPGVGTGTFPGQTHAKDPGGWWYMDVNEEWHHTRGIYPEAPMYNAAMEMQSILIQTAKEVFGG